MRFRIEEDSLGNVEVPEGVYWGSQAERSRKLFQISELTIDPLMIDVFVMIKKASAEANLELGLLKPEVARAIIQAADEILTGHLRDQFPLDPFHMGAGTSLNMNVNEVLANRAEKILGGKKGEYQLVHPNNDVNYGQSTNDTFPTAMRMMSRILLEKLFSSVDILSEAFTKKAKEFDHVLKSARTHLQDAVPIRLGQEFAAYALTVKKCCKWLEYAATELEELGIGGSAAGTGMNTHPKYRYIVVEKLKEYTGIHFRNASDLREAMQSNLGMSALASSLRILCLELTRITNDIRLMASGPLTGFAELKLPPVQPGSSIMPGKVNPSMAENLNIILYQVLGQTCAIDYSVQAGQLELNVMMPGMAFSAHFSLRIITNGINSFVKYCVDGIKADEERCQFYAETSPSLATALNSYIGYEAASEVVKQSLREKKSIPEIVRENHLMDEKTLARVLDPRLLTEPGIPGKSS